MTGPKTVIKHFLMFTIKYHTLYCFIKIKNILTIVNEFYVRIAKKFLNHRFLQLYKLIIKNHRNILFCKYRCGIPPTICASKHAALYRNVFCTGSIIAADATLKLYTNNV